MSLVRLTRYHSTVAPLISQLREAAVDFEAFEKPLILCELTDCRATCCHDGAVLSEEEADFIQTESQGGVMTTADGRLKTETVSTSEKERADNFPAHFSKTRCVFLDENHRCAWQLRSIAEKKHPWFYKPISCWMHPVLVKMVNGRPLLTVLAPEHDPVKFASCTPCGALGKGIQPARVTLHGELQMLSQLSGRDFLQELSAPSL